MIERSVGPTDRRVAHRAVRRESRRYVARIIRSVEICLMARIAIRRQRCVVVVGVALRAGHCPMRPGKRESGLGVIERRRAPPAGGMTRRATGGKP